MTDTADHRPDHDEPRDNVRYLPARRLDRDDVEVTPRTGTEIEHTGTVHEGEVLTAREYNARQRELFHARMRYYRRDIVTAYRVTRTVATHRRTKTFLRHAFAFPTSGAAVAWRRWRDARGLGRYERQMRAAEAAADQDALRYWREAAEEAKDRRHTRTMAWLKYLNPFLWIKYGVASMLAFALFLLTIGIIIAITSGDIAAIIGPIVAVLNAIAFLVWLVTAYGALLAIGGTAAVLFALYSLGRKHADVPAWLAAPAPDTTGGDVMDQLPDENTIVNALHNLNIPGFKAALKGGWRVRFRMPPTVDGKGWRVQLDLPPACPVEEIVKRKAVLAHNLVRYPIEVWPTEPSASVLDLWVANPGVLSGPVDPWPLLAELDTVTTDYFAGVPAGVTIKGDVVNGRQFEANHVYGGMMGSGKSSLAITQLCGVMLDPLVDIDVVVMAENADYDPMRPRLRSLTTGAGDDTVERCMALLHELYAEISVRGQALREHDARAVTRELATKDVRLRPRVMVIDECQNLFIGEHGKAAIEVTTKLMSTARKYAITLLFLTPEPSKDALPRKLISIASNKACFAIGDHQANDAVLGSGSYKAGISAVGLTPKTDDGPGDVGTCMQRGFTGTPGLLRAFFVGQDDVHRVTERAMELREQHGITAAAAPVVEPVERDLLADVLAVFAPGEEKVKATDVCARLRRLAPGHYPDGMTGETLRDQLGELGCNVTKAGVLTVYANRVRAALADRDSE